MSASTRTFPETEWTESIRTQGLYWLHFASRLGQITFRSDKYLLVTAFFWCSFNVRCTPESFDNLSSVAPSSHVLHWFRFKIQFELPVFKISKQKSTQVFWIWFNWSLKMNLVLETMDKWWAPAVCSSFQHKLDIWPQKPSTSLPPTMHDDGGRGGTFHGGRGWLWLVGVASTGGWG